MFNIGKILLFVVTMITGLAFLFYMVNPFLPLWCHGLITVHRIKTVLTLLSPIIFGAITAYIAYQQHRLSRTQANISRDQRDIAHNKIRLEHHEKLIIIYNDMTTLYRELYSLERALPYELMAKRAVDFHIRAIEELSIEGKEKNVKQWATDYIEKTKEIEKLHDKCWINQQECKFMLDKKTYQTIFDFGNKAGQLFESKKNSMKSSIQYNEDKTYINIIKKLDDELDTLLSEVTYRMTPYMDIRDIIAPGKFD